MLNNYKTPKVRSKKLTQSARGESCTFRIPGVCNGDNDTVVFCHAPSIDKGMRTKSDDFWGADGCSACHAFVDNHVPSHNQASYWFNPIYETQKRLIKKGLITIK